MDTGYGFVSLVGFDFRAPIIYTDFVITNDKGVSTWLIGRDNLNDVPLFSKNRRTH